ncbi:hypothetical protein SAMN05192554_11686 [Haloarchaeobius iranensis]|uniref:Uncharacterized protein n=1 Tax=Haloarchaeobius iranensis TaxID=996166 RepID=A0A1G9YYH3_9EURY|nr:hypothetical protein SAMN05192554_11686 [Haloarchaeobius iranensis]
MEDVLLSLVVFGPVLVLHGLVAPKRELTLKLGLGLWVGHTLSMLLGLV